MSVPGWNDPPQFSHASLDSHGIRRSRLNKRPSPHSHPSPLPPSSLSPLCPPPSSAPPTQTSQSGEVSSGVVGVTDSGGGGVEDDYSRVVDGFQMQLERHKTSMTEKEVEEVMKRLGAMRTQWNSGALSPHVMTHTTALLTALEAGRVEEARRIQVALMVDHTSEVNMWMMGVKRLIARAEKQTDNHKS
ncbi:Steroid receptor RNA activator 1 [Geodia barretti]|uniref:Steroid receptor RNA activator 1 n=1 Tax=Geodia barretti TaxID=519541 RepID=A0AA35RUG3_GEOBA|nr:Steroid receptor RNA activator 1 [Geodia barretti]